LSRKVITDNLALAGKRRVIPRWKKLVYLLVRVMLLAFLALSFYYGESYFRITSVLVEGNSDIPEAEIVRISGVSETGNIFLVREKQVITALKNEYPLLETVQVTRSLPGTVKIKISERNPVAAVMTSGGYWLMDRNAVCYQFSEEEITDYPLITGLDDHSIIPGSILDCPTEVKLLTTFFECWQGSDYIDLKQIDLRNSYNLILYGTPQVEIWLGDDQKMEQKLILIEKSMPHLDTSSLLKLDVRSGSRLVVAGSMAVNEKEVDP